MLQIASQESRGTRPQEIAAIDWDIDNSGNFVQHNCSQLRVSSEATFSNMFATLDWFEDSLEAYKIRRNEQATNILGRQHRANYKNNSCTTTTRGKKRRNRGPLPESASERRPNRGVLRRLRRIPNSPTSTAHLSEERGAKLARALFGPLS